MTALLSEQPLAELELRNRIAYVLSEAGAYCGDCSFEPGDRGKCTDCERCWASYANALLPLFTADRAGLLARLELERRESAHQQAERVRVQARVAELEAQFASARAYASRWTGEHEREPLTNESLAFSLGYLRDLLASPETVKAVAS